MTESSESPLWLWQCSRLRSSTPTLPPDPKRRLRRLRRRTPRRSRARTEVHGPIARPKSDVAATHEPPQGRQVLDCGDGVFGVTAMALAVLETSQLAAHTATQTQSGDSEDSVAALQDVRARTRFALDSGCCLAGCQLAGPRPCSLRRVRRSSSAHRARPPVRTEVPTPRPTPCLSPAAPAIPPAAAV